MAQSEWDVSPFKAVWNNALADYFAKLPPNHKYDLRDPKWLAIRDVNDLTIMLKGQHDDFNEDTTQGKAFSTALHAAFGPLGLIITMFGGAMGMAFPPSSQVLGAVCVLIAAGKRVTGAFDALRGLFERIGSFLQRLQPLTSGKDRVPKELENILRAILVCMLDVCALATKRSFHVSDKVDRYKLRHVLSGAQAKVTEFFRQLVTGGDSEVDGAVGKLEKLVDEETRMTVALTKKDTAEIKSISVDIQGLNLVIQDVTLQIQQDTAEIRIKVDDIKEDTRQTREDTAEIRTTITKLVAVLQEDRSRTTTGTEKTAGRSDSKTASQNAEDKNRSDLLKRKLKLHPSDMPAQIQDQLHDEMFVETTKWFIEHESVQQWLEGKLPFLLISGDSGVGKTFLAGRIIDELKERYKQGIQHPSRKSTGYFFCRGGEKRTGLDSANCLARTLAFQLASNDPIYDKWILEKFDKMAIEKHSDTEERPYDIVPHDLARVEEVEQSSSVKSTQPEDNTGLAGEHDIINEQEGLTGEAQSAAIADGETKIEQSIEQRLPFELWNVLFQDFYRDSRGSAYLVIDALDVLTEDERIAFWRVAGQLSQINASQAESRLSLMISVDSGTLSEAILYLSTDVQHISVNRGNKSKEMQQFVEQEMLKAWNGRLYTPELYGNVKEAILEACHGNFAWASLVMDEIASFSREDRIRNKLKSLPRTLEEAKGLQLQRLNRQLGQDELEDLHSIIAWVYCAINPLNLAQLDAILAMRHPDCARVTDLESRLRNGYGGIFDVSGEELVDEESIERRYKDRLAQGELCLPKPSAISLDDFSKLPSNSTSSSAVDLSAQARVATVDDRLDQRFTKASDITVTMDRSIFTEECDELNTQHSMLNFTVDSMQAMVLLGCLNVICEAPNYSMQVVDAANSYCAKYLPEHLQAVDISKLDDGTKIQIAHRLMRILRSDEDIDRWIKYAGEYMAYDLLESTLVCDKMLSWFQDPAVKRTLNESEQTWVNEAVLAPQRVLLHRVALGHARRWLRVWDLIRPSFLFLNTYLAKVEPSDPEIADDKDPDYSLDEADNETILRVARWAGLDEDGEWNARVGSAIRVTDRNDDAIDFYKKGVELSPEQGWEFQIASTFGNDKKEYSNAIDWIKKAIDILREGADNGLPSHDPDSTYESFCIQAQRALAGWYDDAHLIDDSIRTYFEILADWESPDLQLWETKRATALDCFTVQHNNDRWEEALTLLIRINSHPRRATKEFFKVYDRLISGNAWLRVIMETQRLDVLDQFLANAFEAAAWHGAPGQTSDVRFNAAVAYRRLSKDRDEEAIRLLNAVISDPEVLDLSNDYYWLKQSSEERLALIYFNRVLHAREMNDWESVGKYAHQLVMLVEQGELGADADSSSASALYLAAWHRIHGRPDRAKDCARHKVQFSLDMLSDTDPDNDLDGWNSLAGSLGIVGDRERSVAAHNMARQIDLFGTDTAEAGDAHHDETETEMPNGVDAEPQVEVEPRDSEQAVNVTSAKTTETYVGRSGQANPDETENTRIDVPQIPEKNGTQTSETQCVANGDVPGKSEPEQSHEPTLTEDKELYYCNGPCMKSILDKSTLWSCSYCNMAFCQPCHEIIMANESKTWFVCSSMHEHFEVPGVTAKYAPGMIRVGDEEVLVQDFLSQLKEEWNIK